MRDKDRAVIRSENKEQLNTLLEFGGMELKMCKSGTTDKRAKCLTKDTSKAIWHTCNGLQGVLGLRRSRLTLFRGYERAP